MKFGKYFKRQKVPEWTDAYMDYNSLKSILGEIARHKQTVDQNQPSVSSRVLRSFSGLTVPPSNVRGKADVEDQDRAIDIGLSGSRHKYKTRFLRESEEGGDVEAVFFQKLDDELNKVNVFYKDKVEEVLQEADLINKQMDALVALRIRVQNPDLVVSEMKPHPSESNGFEQTTDNKVEAKIPKQSNSWEESVAGSNHITSPDRDSRDKANKCEEHPLEILDHVRINNTLESPASTLKEIFGESNDFKLRFKKDELKEVDDRLRRIFIEFYQKLRHLRHYSFINLSAFAKILKKYEKVTSRRVSRSYMKIVENSHIGNSDEVSVLLDRVEGVFIKHFCRSNRSEAMKSLRPKLKREKHRVTFFSGFFAGCSFALVAAIVLRIESRNLMEKQEGYLYMANVFPLYSFFGFIILHMLTYAADIYFWRRYKVNYSFIFGFKQGTDLGYWEVFLLSSGLAVLSLASFMVNLYLDLGTRPHHYKTFTQLVPLGLVLIVLGITFCPFDILFRPSRFFFVRCLFRCICAPLYQVKQPDFFLADSLTSQVQALRCLELYVCYYGLGEYSQRENRCHSHNGYNVFYFIVVVVPYWIRFLQCMRRLWEDKDPVHGYNGFKYFLTIFAVVFRTASELKKGTVWFVLGLISSGLAIVMNTYWDIAIDWGLLRRHSKNFLLRDKLVVSQKSVYYAAIILNVVLRIVWMQQVVEFKLPALHKMAAATSIACLEIIRRGIWSFFRLENEHLNNVGHYRAFKSIPHPFTYDDDDEEGEDGGDKDD